MAITPKEIKTMSKQAWFQHILSTGLPLGPEGKEARASHAVDCKSCKARRATQRANRGQRERNGVMRDLGLVKTPYGWE